MITGRPWTRLNMRVSDWTNCSRMSSRRLASLCLMPRVNFFQLISSLVVTASSNYWLRSSLIFLREINVPVNANVICYSICNESRRKTTPSANSVRPVGAGSIARSAGCNSIPLRELPSEMHFWSDGRRMQLRLRSTPIQKFSRSCGRA